MEYFYLLGFMIAFFCTLWMAFFIVPRRVQGRGARFAFRGFFLVVAYRCGLGFWEVATHEEVQNVLTPAGLIGVILLAVFAALSVAFFGQEQRLR
jgi:heme A synthase